jgi:lysophospholipase L1-like esterase
MREKTPWYITTSTTKSRLDGKQLHLFGDGICFGLGSSNIPQLAYPALLTSRYGIKVSNHALGDATIGEYGDEYLSERSVVKQIENASINGDFAIIFAGSNDYKSGAAKIGANTDLTQYSFKGALNTCIKNLLEKNPGIKILIVTPFFRARLEADDFRNSDDTPINELYLVDYANAMKEIAEYNHIPCLDLHSTGMINRYNFTHYLKDRFYLNDAGHDMLANKIFSALDYLY